jgi:hypothetical protein
MQRLLTNKNIIFIAIIILQNLCAFANTDKGCKLNNTTINDGESVSLFENGKSLANFKVQDQDGLGTCYANATTAILTTFLPNNQTPSYIHAALAHGAIGWRGKWQPSDAKKEIIKNGDFIGDSGNFCASLEAMKTAGGACPSEFSYLESTKNVNQSVGVDNENFQKEVLKVLGNYFDQIQDKTLNSETQKNTLNDLKQLTSFIDKKRDEFKKSCLDNTIENPGSQNPIESMILVNIDFALLQENPDYDKKCDEFLLEVAKRVASPESKIESDKYKFKLKDETKFLYDQLIRNDKDYPKIKDALEKDDYFKKYELHDYNYRSENDFSKDTQKNFKDIIQRINTEIISAIENEVLNDHYSPEDEVIIRKECNVANGNIFTSAFNARKKDEVLTNNFIKQIATSQKKFCAQENLNQFLADSETFLNEYSNEPLFCKNHSLPISSLVSVLAPLIKINQNLSDDFIQRLAPNKVLDLNNFASVLFPGCEKKENLIDISKFSCASFSMCNYRNNFENTNFPADYEYDCYKPWDAKAIFRHQLVESINSNKAIGLSVCTGFMQSNTLTTTSYCQNEDTGIDKHNNHAMTVSGYKCVNGKIMYELLNSWGVNSCPEPAKNEIKDQKQNLLMSCVKDSNGNLTGRFYVDEEYLIDKTILINKIAK